MFIWIDFQFRLIFFVFGYILAFLAISLLLHPLVHSGTYTLSASHDHHLCDSLQCDLPPFGNVLLIHSNSIYSLSCYIISALESFHCCVQFFFGVDRFHAVFQHGSHENMPPRSAAVRGVIDQRPQLLHSDSATMLHGGHASRGLSGGSRDTRTRRRTPLVGDLGLRTSLIGTFL